MSKTIYFHCECAKCGKQYNKENCCTSGAHVEMNFPPVSRGAITSVEENLIKNFIQFVSVNREGATFEAMVDKEEKRGKCKPW